MSDDQFLEENHEDDDDIMGLYLIDEPQDIDILLFPKIEFDIEQELEEYYKLARQCKNKQELKEVLYQFYLHIAKAVTIQNEIQHLQNRAKMLEYNINEWNQEGKR